MTIKCMTELMSNIITGIKGKFPGNKNVTQKRQRQKDTYKYLLFFSQAQIYFFYTDKT